MTPRDEVHALAMRALEDAISEQQAAATALARANAALDKHMELMALAQRIAPMASHDSAT